MPYEKRLSMTEHAEVTTALYSDLTEDEEAILREFEREVLGTLLKNALAENLGAFSPGAEGSKAQEERCR